MSELEKRALYNLLRMNWVHDKSMKLEPWQVEDYRSLSTEALLEGLKEFDDQVTKKQFLLFAEQCDTPEELTFCYADEEQEPAAQDRAYLIVFELWRRLLPERPSLSIFCDELDHLIMVRDSGEIKDEEKIQDMIASLLDLLDEGADEGGGPHEIFARVSAHSANDIESFLYDYIAEQIDDENYGYASELLDGFIPYILDSRWFDLLHARLLALGDVEQASEKISEIIEDSGESPDLDLNLEVLDFLVHTGGRELFLKIAKGTVDLVESEEDLLDLLNCCANYFHCLDLEDDACLVEGIIEARSNNNPEAPLAPGDPGVKKLLHCLEP